MKLAIVASLALFTAGTAAGQELTSPRLVPLAIDWQAAAKDIGSAADPSRTFVALNAASQRRFPDIADSAVPVLLPFDIDGFRQARTVHPDATPGDAFVLAGFHASKFFFAGPAGYDAAFWLRAGDTPGLGNIDYRKPIRLLFSGFGLLYRLGGPPLPEGELVAHLQDRFPGIRRYFFESYDRYVFQRYGATYAAAIYCQDRPPRRRYLTCRQADRIIERFLDALHLVGGTPSPSRATVTPPVIERPARVAPQFSYFSPGFLIPGTGRQPGLGGRADYTVYGRLRFPLKTSPAFANSQLFNNWGNCDFTGRSPAHVHTKGSRYTCKVNGLRLVFDESAGHNYAYPWRDNFCEHRRYYVGQCPGGQGHQGQDIRPGHCRMLNHGADRCQPYEHDVVAVSDGMILRPHGQQALLQFINTPDTRLRVRYLHMSPKRLDGAGMVSGKMLRQGELVGQVGNYDNFAGGTTYHLHFDLQVPTAAGWTLVNPYMTLVVAYEHLIGARGTEIKRGDSVPAVAAVPPVLGRAAERAVTPQTEEAAATRTKPRENAAASPASESSVAERPARGSQLNEKKHKRGHMRKRANRQRRLKSRAHHHRHKHYRRRHRHRHR